MSFCVMFKYRSFFRKANNVLLTGMHACMHAMPMSVCNAEEKCNVSLALHYVRFEVGMKYTTVL